MFARKINTPPPCVLGHTTALSLCCIGRLAAAAIVKSQIPTISSTMVDGLFIYVIVAVLSVIGV